jgi:hypothetical protein
MIGTKRLTPKGGVTMSRKGWLTVGLSLMLGTGFGAAASAHGQDVIDDGNITEHRA